MADGISYHITAGSPSSDRNPFDYPTPDLGLKCHKMYLILKVISVLSLDCILFCEILQPKRLENKALIGGKKK